ncbi:hypothetical protein JCM10207_006158 [Rhodosporidiobolus poonsookiae]
MPSFARNSSLPDKSAFAEEVNEYINNLARPKQRKALVEDDLYDFIRTVLLNPTSSRYGNAQDRHWAKKMFELDASDDRIVLHKGPKTQGLLPRVALKRELYNLICDAHLEVDHGGRDKTFKFIKPRFSHIPKELVARFVKICPTCTAAASARPSSCYAAASVPNPRANADTDNLPDAIGSPDDALHALVAAPLARLFDPNAEPDCAIEEWLAAHVPFLPADAHTLDPAGPVVADFDPLELPTPPAHCYRSLPTPPSPSTSLFDPLSASPSTLFTCPSSFSPSFSSPSIRVEWSHLRTPSSSPPPLFPSLPCSAGSDQEAELDSLLLDEYIHAHMFSDADADDDEAGPPSTPTPAESAGRSGQDGEDAQDAEPEPFLTSSPTQVQLSLKRRKSDADADAADAQDRKRRRRSQSA